MEEKVEITKQILMGLLERVNINAIVEGSLKEGNIHLDIRGENEGILIGKHGRTLDALQFIINRMVNKQMKEAIGVMLDVNDYRKRRVDNLKKMVMRIADKVKTNGRGLTIGPFNAPDRRIIHLALKEDPYLRTESIGEGEMKRIKIILTN